MRKVPPRIVGVMLVAASAASTLVHRSVYDAAYQGPAQTAEFALGLLTFMLASAGILLLVHGGKLLERGNASGVTPKAQPSEIQARHAIRTSRRPVLRYTPDGSPRR